MDADGDLGVNFIKSDFDIALIILLICSYSGCHYSYEYKVEYSY